MSAIQEALERVRREREASAQKDTSWVEAAAPVDPWEAPRKPRRSLRLGLLVLAGAAVGVAVSQISWMDLPQRGRVFKNWIKGTISDLPKNGAEISQPKGPFEKGRLETFIQQESLEASSGKDAAPSSSGLREAIADSKKMQQEGDPRGAERQLISLLEKEPDSLDGLVALAELYVQHLSEAGKAVALYQKAIHKSPKSASLWVNLGVAQLKNGEPAKAEQTLLSALELDPSLVEAYYNMACALALQGRSREATGFLQKAASMDSRVLEWVMQDPDLVSVRDLFPGKFQLP